MFQPSVWSEEKNLSNGHERKSTHCNGVKTQCKVVGDCELFASRSATSFWGAVGYKAADFDSHQ